MDQIKISEAVSLSIGAGLGALSLRRKLKSLQEFDLGDAGEAIASGARKVGKIFSEPSTLEKVGKGAKKIAKGAVETAAASPGTAAAAGVAGTLGAQAGWKGLKKAKEKAQEKAQQFSQFAGLG